jgi:hypothetical protein
MEKGGTIGQLLRYQQTITQQTLACILFGQKNTEGAFFLFWLRFDDLMRMFCTEMDTLSLQLPPSKL